MDSMDSPSTRRYTRIQTRLAVAFAVLAVTITVTVSVIVYLQMRQTLFNEFKGRVVSLAKLAQLQQYPNLLSNIRTPEDQDTSIYKFIRQENRKIVDSDPSIGSVYVMRMDEQGNIYFVVDAQKSELDAVKSSPNFGEIYEDPGPLLQEQFLTMNQVIVEDDFYTDDWGTWLSAYAPIYKDDGTREGVLGIDLSAEVVTSAQQSILTTSTIILLLTLPFFAGAGWFIGGRLANPIVQLTAGAKRVAEGDLQYAVEINTGDEVEILADTFNIMTAKVNNLVGTLEQRVDERTKDLSEKTHELEEATLKLESRASQLTAVSEVTKAVTTIRDVNRLFTDITETISKQFGFYHVGIFLNDPLDEYTVLRASNSEGGKRLLAQGHRLKIGQVGIVGYVAGTGKPRIALDIGEDAAYFNNPNLPLTKSEMALPLKAGDRTFGVMDVQSTESGAFKPEDVDTLAILADQVSIAIENARLFDEAQTIIRKFVETGWNQYMKKSTQLGVQYSNSLIQPLTKVLDRPEINAVLESGEAITETSDGVKLAVPTIAVPVKVRGVTVGVIDIRSINPNRRWEKTDIAAAQTIADRLAFALENARLIDESQKRVARERAISDMSSKIGSSMDVNTILQQTVHELGKLIGNSEVIIQMRKEPSMQGEGQ